MEVRVGQEDQWNVTRESHVWRDVYSQRVSNTYRKWCIFFWLPLFNRETGAFFRTERSKVKEHRTGWFIGSEGDTFLMGNKIFVLMVLPTLWLLHTLTPLDFYPVLFTSHVSWCFAHTLWTEQNRTEQFKHWLLLFHLLLHTRLLLSDYFSRGYFFHLQNASDLWLFVMTIDN